MRKATILFNPNSGRSGRDAELNHAIDIIQSAGIHTELVICHSSQEASDKARIGAEAGSEIVFACGGDGTISDVIQGLVGTGAALAVLPFGTANALAHDLSLPLHPGAAAQAAIEGRVRRIPLGLVEYMDLNGKRAARYFTVAAGVGVDAHLFYKLTAELKSRSGMAGYYIKAWHLWATHKMRRFEVEYLTHDGARKHALLTELLAVRIRYFGNILRELVPEASLERNDLRAVMCRTASRHAYLRYVAGVLLGRRWKIAGIDLVSCSEIVCRLPKKSDGSDSNSSSVESAIEDRVYVEADGELIGRLPARMTMVPDALLLVVPSTTVEQKSTVQKSSVQKS